MAECCTTIWSHHNLGAKQMDFIEQWFGVSPDGGDGSLEIAVDRRNSVKLGGDRLPAPDF